ncbi:O-antigen ligase family protein [Altererythrobacter sp. Z27]|uniref:O-antigen ligase family protein n=1 Tax=Altererythrobacter sp. Z27 TaxID=3461147 RepID=UPI00404405B0
MTRAAVPTYPGIEPLQPQAGLLGIPWHVWPAILVGYAAMMPRELAISIGSANLDPYRLVLLATLPLMIRQLVKAPLRPHWIDLVAAIVSLWVLVSLLVHEPFARAMETGLALSLDFGLAYLIGRVSIRRSKDFQQLFMALLPGLALITLVLFAESVAYRHLLRPFVASMVGLPPPEIHDQARLGLYRATGPFPHPILGGVFLATLLPIAWFTLDDRRFRIVAIMVAFGMIFTVSSSAILAFLVCAGLIAIHEMQRVTGLPLFPLVLIGTLTFVALILVFSESGLLSFAARRLSLSEASGQWRVLIWQYAGAEIFRNPVIGIGLRDWMRPGWMQSDSIDAHFLNWSMRFGLPAGLGAIIVMLGSALNLLRNSRFQTANAARVSIGISFSIIAIVFSGFTVALWEGLGAWMVMLCGAAVTLGTPPAKLDLRAAGRGDNPG